MFHLIQKIYSHTENTKFNTAQKISSFLWIWSYLLKKFFKVVLQVMKRIVRRKKTYRVDESKIVWGEDYLTMFFEINYIGNLSMASLKFFFAIKEAAAEI